MLKEIVLLLFIPLIIHSMQEEKKFAFAHQKIKSLAGTLEKAKNEFLLNQDICKNRDELEKLKLKYEMIAETCSEEFCLLLRINKSILAQLKTQTEFRKNLVFVLHNTDPAQNATHAKKHEEMLQALTQEINTPKNIQQWAADYDKQQIQKGQPQRYGTCVDPNYNILTPVVGCSKLLQETDLHKINVRREVIGLPSIEEQLADAYNKERMNKLRDC